MNDDVQTVHDRFPCTGAATVTIVHCQSVEFGRTVGVSDKAIQTIRSHMGELGRNVFDTMSEKVELMSVACTHGSLACAALPTCCLVQSIPRLEHRRFSLN